MASNASKFLETSVSTTTPTPAAWKLLWADSYHSKGMPATIVIVFILYVYRRWQGKKSSQVADQATRTELGFKIPPNHSASKRKDDFLRRVGNRYGYQNSKAGFIDDWKCRELPQLLSVNNHNEEPLVYLDFAGAALPTLSQLQAIAQIPLLGNPHSGGPIASVTVRCIEKAKKRILDHFQSHPGRSYPGTAYGSNQDDSHPGYEVLFTSGTTEALRILSERFPFTSCGNCGRHSRLVYPPNSHTSVVGMRGPVLRQGASFRCQFMNEFLQQGLPNLSNQPCNCQHANLVAFPVECNFGGDRLDAAGIIGSIRNLATTTNSLIYTVLDIAKAAGTGPVSLRSLDPDFATCSFYKLFGEPTGLGCLLVKSSVVHLLLERSDTAIHSYFGGGSVDVLIPSSNFAVRRSEPSSLAGLSNGTVHYRGIAALEAGFDQLDRLGGMQSIHEHVVCLCEELVRRLRQLEHDNGCPAIQLYGAWKSCSHNRNGPAPGPTVAFNIQRQDGSFVGYNEVAKLAAINSPPLQLRTGCFCNPGACQLALDLSNEDVMDNYQKAGHVCGDAVDIIGGRPTGAIRASFGKDSSWEDVEALVSFIEHLFVAHKSSSDCGTDSRWDSKPREVVISEIFLFPIKSCAAQQVARWPVNPSSGKLFLDREFALVDTSGSAMRLERYPDMAFLRPVIDLDAGAMTVSAPNRQDLVLRLDQGSGPSSGTTIKVCGDQCGGVMFGDPYIDEWLSSVLGVQCWLARHVDGRYTASTNSPSIGSSLRHPDVAFANEQPVLLVSEHAVSTINEILQSQGQRVITSRHFRPNLVVRLAGQAGSVSGHTEDGWTRLTIADKQLEFDVVGPCARCSMVDIDPTTGMKGKTLRALAEYRRKSGQILFGIFLRGPGKGPQKDQWINEDDIIVCE